MRHTEYVELFDRISNWGRWPYHDDGPIGTLNLLTPARRREGIASVREGVTVSLSTPLDVEMGPDNLRPAVHLMLSSGDPGTADYIGFAPHGLVNTHLDAISHWTWEGKLFNGEPGELVNAYGAGIYSVDRYREGIVGRGVLLDLARYRGVPWLDPTEVVMADELTAVAAAMGTSVREGDLLFVRTGRDRRRREEGREDPALGRAGLHVDAALWVKERGVALMGSDSCHDALPSVVDGVMFPLHGLAIAGLGMPLLDNVELEELSSTCERYERWEFLAVIAPPRVARATGVVVNPIAVF